MKCYILAALLAITGVFAASAAASPRPVVAISAKEASPATVAVAAKPAPAAAKVVTVPAAVQAKPAVMLNKIERAVPAPSAPVKASAMPIAPGPAPVVSGSKPAVNQPTFKEDLIRKYQQIQMKNSPQAAVVVPARASSVVAVPAPAPVLVEPDVKKVDTSPMASINSDMIRAHLGKDKFKEPQVVAPKAATVPSPPERPAASAPKKAFTKRCKCYCEGDEESRRPIIRPRYIRPRRSFRVYEDDCHDYVPRYYRSRRREVEELVDQDCYLQCTE